MLVLPRLSAEDELRRELAEVCWKLYERGYVVATDGNVSVRLDRANVGPQPFSQ